MKTTLDFLWRKVDESHEIVVQLVLVLVFVIVWRDEFHKTQPLKVMEIQK